MTQEQVSSVTIAVQHSILLLVFVYWRRFLMTFINWSPTHMPHACIISMMTQHKWANLDLLKEVSTYFFFIVTEKPTNEEMLPWKQLHICGKDSQSQLRYGETE